MLEEKVEKLTAEVVALRKAIEGGLVAVKGAEPAAAKGKTKAVEADEKTTAAKGKTKAAAAKGKTKKVEPEHDEDEVSALFKKAAKEDRPACKKYLKKVGCADLAELLTQPELYDAAYDFAEELLSDDDDDDDDDDADGDDDDDDDDD